MYILDKLVYEQSLGEYMIFNIMLFVTAITYWYLTGHVTPAIIGSLLPFMYTERLAFPAILTAGAAISAVIYCFWLIA